MRVFLNLRQLGCRRQAVCEHPFLLEHSPRTVAELIAEAVAHCVAAYNARFDAAQAVPLAEADMQAMASLGKIAFGFNHGESRANEQQALSLARQAYEDGLVRIFIGEVECGALEEAVSLKEGDRLTFIRLTMLTGGFC